MDSSALNAGAGVFASIQYATSSNQGSFSLDAHPAARNSAGLNRAVNFAVSRTGHIASGQTYTLSPSGNRAELNEQNADFSINRNYESLSGILTIDSVSGNVVTFHVTNVVFQVAGTPTGSSAGGRFTLNGSGRASNVSFFTN